MPPAARVTDMHTCPMVTGIVPHVGGPIIPPAVPTVLIDMLPAANVTTMATCVGPPDIIVKGSSGVFLNFLPAARMGDLTAHGGVIVLGSPTCMIGEVGSGSPGAGGMGAVISGLAASNATQLQQNPSEYSKSGSGGPVTNTPEVAAQIQSASTFKTEGLDRDAADSYLSTPDGQQMLTELTNADPAASPDTIYGRAVDLLASGSNPPAMTVTDAPLVKIVPQGQGVSPYSPFFTTPDKLQAALASGKKLSDYFGLPVKSGAANYDVYYVTPKAPTPVFTSTVAPTSELGGAVKHAGGASQTLIPNRNAWSPPVKVGSIPGG